MRIPSSILFCAVMLSGATAGGERLYTGSADLNGAWLMFETRLEPGSAPIQHHGGGMLTEKNVLKRHLCNFDNQTYFGYDLTLEPLSDGRVRLRFARSSLAPARMKALFPEVSKWKALPLPRGRVTLDVRPGETAPVELLADSSGHKMTEYVTVKSVSGR